RSLSSAADRVRNRIFRGALRHGNLTSCQRNRHVRVARYLRGSRRVSQSIGNDFFDFGGGNSRSRSIKSSFVNLILREVAFSRTCASVLAFGIAMMSGWRNTQASAIWAGVASCALAIFFSIAFFSNAPL